MNFKCSICKHSGPVHGNRDHYKSEWHVYNLKRSLVALPPLSEEIFNEKKNVILTESVPCSEKKTYCNACKKCFTNSKSYDAHLSSKRHRQNTCAAENSTRLDSAHNRTKRKQIKEPNAIEALPLGSCLFCDRHFSNENVDEKIASDHELALRVLNHMFDAHQFTVPFHNRLVNPAGLLIELGRIVGEERACLYCGKQFYGSRVSDVSQDKNLSISLAAVRNHMLDKQGHKEIWCGESDVVRVALQIAQAEDSNSDVPGVALAGGELFSQFYDQSVVASSLIFPDDEDVYEVRLPSGAVVSHRNMQTVFKQHYSMNLQPYCINSTRNALTHGSTRSGQILPSSQKSLQQKNFHPIEQKHMELQKQYELSVGVQGNLFNRGRLRRQY